LFSGLLAVVGRLPGIFVTFFAGVAVSFASNVFPWSGTPQQRNERKLFLGFLEAVEFAVAGLVFPVGPGGVIDILLLVALPFRLLPKKLPFDFFDLPPILSLGSLAVAPLKPVDVGDGCMFCEEDLDGTWRRPRFFLGTSGVSSVTRKKSFSFCEPDRTGVSDPSVVAVFAAVEVACVEELGGWGVFVTK